MDDLQYIKLDWDYNVEDGSVLNLVINGWPSIQFIKSINANVKCVF